MRRNTALTLVETLAVIAAVVVIVLPFANFIWVPGPRGMELARRASCKSNISAIGKGLAIYMASNRDQFPWLVSNNQWDAATGESQQVEPLEKTNYNVSSLLFLLVRDGQGPGRFVCPSTQDVPDPNTKTLGAYRRPARAESSLAAGDSDFNWDFSPYKVGGAEHVSYSYQAPRLDANGEWGSGVTWLSDANLVILADKTPTYDGKNAQFNWANPGSADPKTGMSQNHIGGEMIHLLFADLHVGESSGRADAGIKKDSIYSAAGLDANAAPLDTNQGPGTLKLSDHRSPYDSFLLGPKKMDK